MARTFNGSADYLETAAAVVTAAPFTISAWFNTNSSTANQSIVSLSNSGSGANYWYLNAQGAVANDPVAFAAQQTAERVSFSSSGYTVGTWHHACGIERSSSSRSAYINGGSRGNNTDSSIPAGVNLTTIGRLSRSAPVLYFNGSVAEVAIWNDALTDAEVAALARGVSPLLIRFSNLMGYWPVWGVQSPEIDLTVNHRTMTVTGATAANHAPVTPFSSRLWGSVPLIEAAAAGATGHYYRQLLRMGWA